MGPVTIWTNDGLVYWRIYASLALNDSKYWGPSELTGYWSRESQTDERTEVADHDHRPYSRQITERMGV